jgi:hypothetical protein
LKTISYRFTYFGTFTKSLVVLLLLLACVTPFLVPHLPKTKAAGALNCDITATNDSELKAGVQNSGSGKILCIVPGTYNMRFDPNADPNAPHAVAIPNGEAGKPLIITGYDPTTGTIPVPAARPRIQPQIAPDQADVLRFQDAHDIVIDSLFLDGSSGQTDVNGMPQKIAHDIVKLTYSGSNSASGSTNIIIQNSELAWGRDQGVLLTGQSDYNQFLNISIHDNGTTPGLDHGVYNVFDHCSVFNNLAIGIQAWSERPEIHATHNIIRNCVVYHNGTDPARKEPGILVLANLDSRNDPPISDPENVANTEIYNNVIDDNSAGGIWIGGTSGTIGGATDTAVYNNTVYHNGGVDEVHGIYIGQNTTSIDVQNNISYQNDGGDYGGSNVDPTKNWPEGSVPPFVDITNPDAPDLHLTSHTSPQGSHLAEVPSDGDGGCRPSGTYDMGAYEFGSNPGQCSTWSESS